MEKPAKLDIPEFRPKYIPKTRVKSAHSIQVSSQQLILIAALRNIEPLMSPESREQFQSLLMTEETHEERVAFWRARRDVQKEL